MATAYIGLGANLGDTEAALAQALAVLDSSPDIRVAGVSTLRRTAPVGYVDQPAFTNAAAALDTTRAPSALLDVLLDVERRLGRTRVGPRFGPRTIDLDLLLYDDLVIDEPGLVVPHPRLHERRFVLDPLAELDPDLVVPGRGRVVDLIAALAAVDSRT